MISVLVITHGKMAEGIAHSVELIMGKQVQFSVLGLFENDSIEAFKDRVYEQIVALDRGDGVLVLVDLYGASPFNSAGANLTRLQAEHHVVRIISGVNLPMVLETMNARNYMATLDELYKNALQSGKDGIRELLEDLGQ